MGLEFDRKLALSSLKMLLIRLDIHKPKSWQESLGHGAYTIKNNFNDDMVALAEKNTHIKSVKKALQRIKDLDKPKCPTHKDGLAHLVAEYIKQFKKYAPGIILGLGLLEDRLPKCPWCESKTEQVKAEYVCKKGCGFSVCTGFLV